MLQDGQWAGHFKQTVEGMMRAEFVQNAGII
jgi:hypothetical protein